MEYWPGVDMVVVNYRTPDDLWGFLCSYQAYKPTIPHSLHVVNVCPEQRDRDVVVSWSKEFPFLYTEHEDRVGYATACNEALRIPDRETVAVFNADTRLVEGAVEECHAALWSNEEWGVLGPRQVDDNCRIVAAGVFGTQESPTFDGRWMKYDRGQYNDVRDDVVNVSGSIYFVKRPVWDELTSCWQYQSAPGVGGTVGAFLPTAHFYEETYLSYHAREHGYKVVYYGPVRMVHRWHKSLPVAGKEATDLMRQSREFFRIACDHHGIPHE